MKSKILFLGLFAGFTAGILTGILFAPEKGSKLRRKILKHRGSYSRSFLDKMEDFHESIPEKFKISKQKAEELAAKGKGPQRIKQLKQSK